MLKRSSPKAPSPTALKPQPSSLKTLNSKSPRPCSEGRRHVVEERSRLEAEQSKRFDSMNIIKTFGSFKMYSAQLLAVIAKSDAIPDVDSGIRMDLADTTLEKYVYDLASVAY